MSYQILPISPINVTNYERDEANLQAFWIFCVLVAGKNADTAAKKVSELLNRFTTQKPFEYIKKLGAVALRNTLLAAKSGQYDRISRALTESSSLDLKRATSDELDNVYGVGPKTARFFILHTRPLVQVAVLDTHILKWMKSVGVEDVPEASPSDKDVYEKYERIWLTLYPSYFPNCTPAQADLLIWKLMSGRE
jgi:thermostable 8-oxoguanine DNA glycosylase